MNYKFLFYCLLSVVLITGGGYFFFSSRQEVTAAMYFIGATVAALFFGFRWFTPSGDVKGGGSPGAWPPAVNYCPDFMTLATVQSEQVCIDTVGVGQAGGIATSDGTKIADQYLFHLFLDKSGNERKKLLCDQAKGKQVTWEGVWDGSTCMASTEPPKPPSSS